MLGVNIAHDEWPLRGAGAAENGVLREGQGDGDWHVVGVQRMGPFQLSVKSDEQASPFCRHVPRELLE